MKPLERVLVIDDDETSIFLTKRMLQGIGFDGHILTALNGLEGLKLLKEKFADEQPPQLILLDIKMPVMDGFAFLEELEKLQNIERSATRVVLLTSSHNPWEMEKAKKHEIAAFLHKPLTKEKLHSILLNHCPGRGEAILPEF